jgi:GNAT superfamily N-acetyltransferase
VRRDDEIVGCAALDGRDADEPQFRWFFLGASVRGHGLGHRLLKRAIDTATGFNWPALTLYTHVSLQAAVHLYEAHGFVPRGELPGPHWRQPVDFVRMVRPLREHRPAGGLAAPQYATASP